MKILIISNLYPPFILGGYEILCRQVCDELAQRGHTIQVLTTDHGLSPGQDRHQPVGPVAVERDLKLYLPFDRPAALRRGQRLKTGRANRALTAGVIERCRPDLIFIWSQLRLTVGPARAAEASGLPVAYTFNDEHPAGYLAAPFVLSPKGLLRWAADRFIFGQTTLRGLKLADTTAISRLLKKKLIEAGLPCQKTKVIYQGIPLEHFPVKNRPGSLHQPGRVLYVGQLHAYKGVHTLVEAAHTLNGRVRLTVVGAGPPAYEAELRDLAATGPAEVDFRGRVDHEALPALYREHDVFVFPSIWPEPFGLTYLEAMASGLPVVSTAGGGHGEILEDGRNALIFKEEDAAGLAGCLTRLLADPDLSHSLALAGRQLAAERFTIRRYVDDLEEWLTGLAGGSGG